MKKLIGIILALMIAAASFAFAETAGTPAKTVGGYLLICFKNDDQKSLALVGPGSGEDVLSAFADGSGDYAQRFEKLWNVLGKFEPAMTLDGSVANLCFEANASGKTRLVLNGVVIAELMDAETFAILSGEDRPAVRAECNVRLWTRGSFGAVGEICVRCGEINDGTDRHDHRISQFCDEKHTECMGDPVHHCEACGRNYPCSKSNSHTECAVCSKPWCYKDEGDHAAVECGHRECAVYGNEGAHALCMICGGFFCDGEDHTAAECGLHHSVDAGEHKVCGDCGGFLCDGAEHSHAEGFPEGDVTVEADAAGRTD